jgi:hypothetical protein
MWKDRRKTVAANDVNQLQKGGVKIGAKAGLCQ